MLYIEHKFYSKTCFIMECCFYLLSASVGLLHDSCAGWPWGVWFWPWINGMFGVWLMPLAELQKLYHIMSAFLHENTPLKSATLGLKFWLRHRLMETFEVRKGKGFYEVDFFLPISLCFCSLLENPCLNSNPI